MKPDEVDKHTALLIALVVEREQLRARMARLDFEIEQARSELRELGDPTGFK